MDKKETTEDKLLKIIEYYGIRKQLKHFNSEVFELNEAILDYENSDISGYEIFRIREELADVQVMLEQLRLYYGFSNEEVEIVMNEKIERQLKRIEAEK